MVNYYKLLGLENYVSIDQVKLAYKQKIRQYHPDLNDSEDAVAITQYLNQAKTTLTDAEQKTLYDQQLKMAYLLEIKRLKDKNDLSKILWRKARRAEEEKIKEKRSYERGNKIFPYSYRIVLLLLLLLTGLQLMYSNYFVTYNTFSLGYMVIGVLLFAFSLMLLSNQIYTHYYVKSIDRLIPFDYEKWIAYLLVLSAIIGPTSIYALNEYRKSFHLSHRYQEYYAEIDRAAAVKGQLHYSYEVDGRRYVRAAKITNGQNYYISGNKILIKYALVDPKISEPIAK